MTTEQGATTVTDAPLVIAGRAFRSRLIVGTGKYPSYAVMAEAHTASGAEMATVAVRRVNIADRSRESLLDHIDTARLVILPNTAGCYTADDAIRTAHLAREAGLSNWIKLEVIGDERTLFPDTEALLEATRVLVGDGFVVLPYTNDDPIACRKLEDAGAAAVMPLGAPIGSGLGIQNANNIRIIRERANVPVIVDAGVGTASDAAIAMELGRRRRPHEYRDRGRGVPGRDGRGDAARRDRRPAGPSGRPYPPEDVRDSEQSGRRNRGALSNSDAEARGPAPRHPGAQRRLANRGAGAATGIARQTATLRGAPARRLPAAAAGIVQRRGRPPAERPHRRYTVHRRRGGRGGRERGRRYHCGAGGRRVERRRARAEPAHP